VERERGERNGRGRAVRRGSVHFNPRRGGGGEEGEERGSGGGSACGCTETGEREEGAGAVEGEG